MSDQTNGISEEVARKVGDEYFRLCKEANLVPMAHGLWIEQLRGALTAILHNRPEQEKAEPVGEVSGTAILSRSAVLERPLPPGTKLYIDPPAERGEAQEKAEAVANLEPFREAIVYAATNGNMDKWRRVLAQFDSFAYRYKRTAERVMADADGRAFVDGMGWVIQCSRATEYVARLLSAAPEDKTYVK